MHAKHLNQNQNMTKNKPIIDSMSSPLESMEYITSTHKKLFLRFITSHSNFFNESEQFPEYLTILTNDLNTLGIVRTQSEWLKVLQTWAEIVENETGEYENGNNNTLSDEDERLRDHLKQIRNWIEPTYAELSCIVDNLEELGDLPSLWKAVADKFHRANRDNRNDFEYWRKVYYHITKTIVAKKDLIEYLETNHSTETYRSAQLHTLSKMEIRVLRLRPQLNIPFPTAPIDKNITSHCRICLASSSSSMTYLFARKIGNNTTTLEKLNFCSCMSAFPIKGDGYPEFICTSCSVLLESAYQLKLLCAKTESKLMGVIVQAINIKEPEISQQPQQPHQRPKSSNKNITINQLFDVDDANDYKQIQIIDTMELSDDDGSKNIYLVTSDDICDTEEQTDVITYEINHESVEETISEDVQHDLYEIDDSQEMEDDNVVKPIDLDNNKSVPSADSTSHDFQCENCGLAFKDVSALKIHLKTHGIMRRHECGDCKKNFKTRLSLTIHMRSHTGERPYVCESCGKAFKTVSAVNNHRAIHSDVKEFNCPHCSYSASTKANLKIHDRTHSGIQPYACRYCPMKFSTASNMHKHIRNIHEKLKTNKCDQCDRTFFTRESARKHMVTHTGLKPYTCTQCPQAYGWYNGLKKHVKMQHANIKIPTETSFFNRLKKS